MDEADKPVNKAIATWLPRVGITFTICVIVFGLFWTFCSSGAKKPLGPGEDKHWQDSTEQH